MAKRFSSTDSSTSTAASYGLGKEPAGDTGCANMTIGAPGFQMNHNVSLWSSPDLATWTPHGAVLQMQQVAPALGVANAILFCPKALYDTARQRWVLWFNYIANGTFALSYYAVATAPAPDGPYTVVTPRVRLLHDDVGDFNLLQDGPGGPAYVVYTSLISAPAPNHRMSVELLAPDYTDSARTGSSGFFGDAGVEAPALFRRGPVYYALFGACCCYCQPGSAIAVHTAPSPLGPWATRGTIDVRAPSACGAIGRQAAAAMLVAAAGGAPLPPPHAAGDGSGGACGFRASNIHAQQTDVALYVDDGGATQALWYGDGWQQSPDGLKGHECVTAPSARARACLVCVCVCMCAYACAWWWWWWRWGAAGAASSTPHNAPPRTCSPLFTFPLTFMPDGNISSMTYVAAFNISVRIGG